MMLCMLNTISLAAGRSLAEQHGRLIGRPHLGYLDGLRAVAMLWVLLGHAGQPAFDPGGRLGDTPHWLRLPIRFLMTGHYAVDIFIALSGFCLALPAVSSGRLRGSAMDFFRKRARRILPPYYFSLLFAIAVSALAAQIFGGRWDQGITLWGGITHLFLVHDLFPSTATQINGVLWSVSVEWRIYFLFPLLLLLWRKIGIGAATLAAVAGSYLLYRVMQHTPFLVMSDDGIGSCPHFIGLFAMGAGGAFLTFSKQLSPGLIRLRNILSSPWAGAILLLAVLAVTGLAWSTPHSDLLKKAASVASPYMPRDFLVGVWAVSMMVAAGRFPNQRALRFLSARPLVFLGTFAYSTYLVHKPILNFLGQVLEPLKANRPFELFLIELTAGSALVFGISYLFHLAFERPFMSKPGQTAPQTERQAEAAAIVSPAP